MKGGYTSFNSFIPAEMRLQVLWGGGGWGVVVNWLHNQTFPNFERLFFFINSLQQHSRVGSQEAAALTVGAEIFLYL